MPFLKGGWRLWPHFSQTFSDKNEEFLCSSERKFPEFFKTHPTFVSRPLLVPSMAHQTLSSVFFGTPCIQAERWVVRKYAHQIQSYYKTFFILWFCSKCCIQSSWPLFILLLKQKIKQSQLFEMNKGGMQICSKSMKNHRQNRIYNAIKFLWNITSW